MRSGAAGEGRRPSSLLRAAALAAISLTIALAWTGAGAGHESAPAAGLPPAGQLDEPEPAPGRRAGRLTVLLGGDILLDIQPGRILSEAGAPSLFEGWLRLRSQPGVDLGLANLECALTTSGTPAPGKKYTFRGDPAAAGPGLALVGIDGVSLANNHTLDFGPDGLTDTLTALEASGVAAVGAGPDLARAWAPAWFECNGLRVAFLAFTSLNYLPPAYASLWAAGPDRPGVAPLEPAGPVLAAIAAAHAGADVVIVSFHWGFEYGEVTAAQSGLGRAAVDAGADIVFGHHPHIAQPVELYRGRPIIYSLGNLVFHSGQPDGRRMMAALVSLELDGKGGTAVAEIGLYPLLIDGGRTVAMPAAEADGFLAQLAAQSAMHGTQFQLEPGLRLVARPR